MERNITKKVYKSIFIGLFSAFFVFSSFSFVACGSTNVENTTKGTKLKSNEKI